MIILFAESEYKIQKHAKHGITVICFLSFDFITSRAKIPSFKSFFGQHNEMIWRSTRTFKIQKQNKSEIPNNRLCSLHHFLWTLLSSFLRFTLIPMFGFYDKLSSHSLSLCLRTHSISKKHNRRVNKNFVELLPGLETFLLFSHFCPWKRIPGAEAKKK